MFTNNRTRNHNEFSITTTNGTIDENTTVEYLGVTTDHKLTLENHVQLVKKQCIAKGIICKLKHHVSLTVLRSVYYAFVYSHLQHGETLWENTSVKCLKKIEVQQNLLVEILAHAPFLKTKVASIYHCLDFLTLNNIFKLEVLKFVFNFKKKEKYLNASINIFNQWSEFIIILLDLLQIV